MSDPPNIYLVYNLRRSIAAWTVKHEMVTWLRSQDNPRAFSVLRVRNGYGYLDNKPFWFDIDELLS